MTVIEASPGQLSTINFLLSIAAGVVMVFVYWLIDNWNKR